MLKTPASLSLAGLLALAHLAAAPARADDPVGLRSNHRLITGEARGILGLAHPTVRYTGVENDRRTDYRDGSYQLAYSFTFRDGAEDGYRVIRFNFDNAGKLTGLTPGASSTLFPAFFGSDLILEVLKTALRDDPKTRDDPLVKELLKVRNAQDFLLKYLQWRQGT